MNVSPPRIDQASAGLNSAIRAVSDTVADFEAALFGINDEKLVDAFRAPLQVGHDLIAFHGARAASTIADDAANLRSLIARHHIPREDPELGVLESLKRLRSARGNLIADLDDLLIAAAGIGLRPRAPSLVPPPTAPVERPGVAGLLAGLERRLSLVQKKLDVSRPEAAEEAHTPQQAAIVRFFVENASLQVAVARLETTAAGPVDFATLTRAVEAMVELTRDFIVSVRAMRDKMTRTLRDASEGIRPLVGRVAKGLVAVIYRVRRIVRPASRAEPPSPSSAGPVGQPTDMERAALDAIRRAFGVDDDLAWEILKRGVIRHHEGGSTILELHAKAAAAFLMMSGRAHAILYSVEGQVVLLAEYREGDMFGALGELDPAPEEAEVVAAGNVTTLSIESPSLIALAEEYGAIGMALSRLLLRQLRRATSRIYERSSISAVGRVYAELLRLARQSPGLTLTPPPLLSELAARVSTTRETASRAVSALERRGIVRRDAGSLTILKPDRLEELII